MKRKRKCLEETLAIRLVLEDRLTTVPAIHHVANRPGKFHPHFAPHEGRVASSIPYINIKNPFMNHTLPVGAA